jgi:hypothetical protein
MENLSVKPASRLRNESHYLLNMKQKCTKIDHDIQCGKLSYI